MLVADDDPDTLGAVVAMLEDLDFQNIRAVSDGIEVLEALQKKPEDVLLLDLMMPNMDGYEVLKELRTNARSLRPGRVVVMSAHVLENRSTDVTLLGADRFLQKPFTLADLESAVRD